MKLHRYQVEAIAGVHEALRRTDSVVLQMPTGSGKTVTAAEFIRQESGKGPVWFICHRREIIRQASKTLSRMGIRHDVIAPQPEKMGLGVGYTRGASVSIASVQTLARRDRNAHPRLVVWDECHHAAASSWAKIKGEFADAHHVGLTATPERLDGKGLSGLFSELICGPSIASLIEDGLLSRVRMFAPTQPDLTKARISMGDYRKDDADAIMNTPVLIGSAVDEYRRHADGSRAIVFATSVEASKQIADRFNEAGVIARHVDATTPLNERDTAVADLASGRLKVLTNVEVFTEGVDVPAVDTIILMRPTRSLALYLQMIGRGMRTAPGKDRLTVLDHAGLVHEHGLADQFDWDWSLEGGARSRRIDAARQNGEVTRRCPKCTCAHAVAASCPECGYAYPTGREVGECDGLLREVSAGDYSTRSVASIAGVAVETVALWRSKGMPRTSVADALLWAEENATNKTRPFWEDDPSDFMTRQEAAKQARCSISTINRWTKNGLPHSSNGLIRISTFDAWVSVDGIVLNNAGGNKGDTVGAASKALGLSPQTIYRFEEAGMPTLRKGVYDLETCRRWIEATGRSTSKMRPPQGFETVERFAGRIAVSRSVVGRWKLRGLPVNRHGHPHIQKGLEWVRDNADVEIPGNAWPQEFKEPAE